MDLVLIKFHLIEIIKVLEKEPNNPVFVRLYRESRILLNSHIFQSVKEENLVSDFVLQNERKRRQAVERLLKKILNNPTYPDEVKSDIVKAHKEILKKYRKQMKSLHQKDQQVNADAG